MDKKNKTGPGQSFGEAEFVSLISAGLPQLAFRWTGEWRHFSSK
jgi:hypothetical protein